MTQITTKEFYEELQKATAVSNALLVMVTELKGDVKAMTVDRKNMKGDIDANKESIEKMRSSNKIIIAITGAVGVVGGIVTSWLNK